MLEEASAQVAQQAEALSKLGSESDGKAAELKDAQAKLSTAIASLDSANADLAEQTELISSLKVENTGKGVSKGARFGS
jgi:peptidoglycan hydrolase CwlO-like protein